MSGDDTDPTVYLWWVPLTHTNNFDTHPAIVWMSEVESQRLFTLGATNDQWVIFNVDQKGISLKKFTTE